MTHIDEHSKEGIFENSELKLLKQLSDLLEGSQVTSPALEDEKLVRKIGALALSPSRFLNEDATAAVFSAKNGVFFTAGNDCNDEVIDFNEVMNGSGGAAAVSSYLEKMLSHEDEDDEADEENAANRIVKENSSNFLLEEAEEENENETESEDAAVEIKLLEKFKQVYQNETKLQEHRHQKFFEKLFNLILTKRLCSRNWLTSNYSSKNVYYILYAVRILLRNVQFQKQFIQTKNSFNALTMLLSKYVKVYQAVNKNVIISAHIIDLLLNISTKILTSDVFLATIEQRNKTPTASKSQSANLLNDIIASFFSGGMHSSLIQLVERSGELCHVHSALNLLIHIYQISPENRSRLVDDLDLTDQLLLMLQEYDETSKRHASKLLSLLCGKEKVKKEIINLDGIQILLSLLNINNNFETVWNVIWCLVQLCSHDDNKKEIRLMGGIPLALSLLCDTHFGESSSSEKDDESTHRHLKGKLQIQAACCALVGELALNESNSYHIVNSNGVYLVASKLLLSPTSSASEANVVFESEKSHEIQRLHRNVWRTLRLLFSTERHRVLIKKIIPFSMFEKFVDIGNYKKDLKLYQPLLESFYSLSKDELENMKSQIRSINQTQVPTNYINDYAVYEIIGSGAFGRVHKVKKKNSNYFLAMKEINTFNLNALKDKSLGEIVNEVTIIRKNLKHPNIVRYIKTFKENDCLYIVMELIDGEPLSQHVRSLKERQDNWPEDKIWNLFIQIVLALKYLHKEKNIVHRDLTSNNIMLSENDKITITDFGLAKLKENDCSRMTSVVGTMFYSCPEIIKNEPYNEKADVWALGCLLYEMCCWEPPFLTQNMLALATRITTADYDRERIAQRSYSPLVSHVVQSCLMTEPLRRPDIVGVAALIAEKILTYTDGVRYQCVHLEKKLEKEKSRTQKMLCNKQDLNHRSSAYQGPLFKDEKAAESEDIATSLIRNQPSIEVVVEPVSTFMSQPHSLSDASLQTSSKPVVPSSPSKFAVIAESSHSNDSGPVSPSQSHPSPNAKLPPLKNPKSKILMKNNIKNKQQQQQPKQVTLATTKMAVSNQSLDQESNTSGGSTISLQISQSSDGNTVKFGSYGEHEKPSDQQPTTAVSAVANGNNTKIQRSSSSSVLEKRSSQSKKSRPTSASMLPVYKKLRPIEDPILQILDQVHKIMFITQLPPSGKKNMKRKLVERYKRSLFNKKRSSAQIKSELMKLIKNSTELVEMEMIGLKNFHGCCFDPNESSSNNEALKSACLEANLETAVAANDFDQIVNLNTLTYEQFQDIIEELLQENDYHSGNPKHLREELPSID